MIGFRKGETGPTGEYCILQFQGKEMMILLQSREINHGEEDRVILNEMRN